MVIENASFNALASIAQHIHNFDTAEFYLIPDVVSQLFKVSVFI